MYRTSGRRLPARLPLTSLSPTASAPCCSLRSNILNSSSVPTARYAATMHAQITAFLWCTCSLLGHPRSNKTNDQRKRHKEQSNEQKRPKIGEGCFFEGGRLGMVILHLAHECHAFSGAEYRQQANAEKIVRSAWNGVPATKRRSCYNR